MSLFVEQKGVKSNYFSEDLQLLNYYKNILSNFNTWKKLSPHCTLFVLFFL